MFDGRKGKAEGRKRGLAWRERDRGGKRVNQGKGRERRMSERKEDEKMSEGGKLGK